MSNLILDEYECPICKGRAYGTVSDAYVSCHHCSNETPYDYFELKRDVRNYLVSMQYQRKIDDLYLSIYYERNKYRLHLSLTKNRNHDVSKIFDVGTNKIKAIDFSNDDLELQIAPIIKRMYKLLNMENFK